VRPKPPLLRATLTSKSCQWQPRDGRPPGPPAGGHSELLAVAGTDRGSESARISGRPGHPRSGPGVASGCPMTVVTADQAAAVPLPASDSPVLGPESVTGGCPACRPSAQAARPGDGTVRGPRVRAPGPPRPLMAESHRSDESELHYD
jgi:hypothetical protein